MVDTALPDLPSGYVLDPQVEEHRPEIGVWWIWNPETRHRTAWNATGSVCPVCQADEAKQPDCSFCAGRGLLDSIPFCDRPWDQVIPGLYLGGHMCQWSEAAPLGEALPGWTFDYVVSLHRESTERFRPDCPESSYRMPDAPLDAKHAQPVIDLATNVVEALRINWKVLVRCQAGINRSALVCGIAMIQMGWTADDAIARMREVRSPWVLFNTTFVEFLHEYERHWREA